MPLCYSQAAILASKFAREAADAKSEVSIFVPSGTETGTGAGAGTGAACYTGATDYPALSYSIAYQISLMLSLFFLILPFASIRFNLAYSMSVLCSDMSFSATTDFSSNSLFIVYFE